MKVIYSEKMNADTGDQPGVAVQSPSARKPKEVAAALKDLDFIEFVEPEPVTIDDIKMVHDHNYVDGIMNLKIENGFGTKSQSVIDSLPYTVGSMVTACRLATKDSPTCALVSGFHHAGYHGYAELGYFCTFNGLMVAALDALSRGNQQVAIVDCDMHHGNGTDDILDYMPNLKEKIIHISFGRCFVHPGHAWQYLGWLGMPGVVHDKIAGKVDLIIYQAGADVHVDDPYGGILTTEQIYARDLLMFSMAKHLDIPIAWNLAGGYQLDLQKVIDIHLNTFKACREVYSN